MLKLTDQQSKSMATSELGQQMVKLCTLLTRAAQDSYNSLKDLVHKCSSSTELSDTDKKISMLKFLTKTKQRMTMSYPNGVNNFL